MNEEEIKQKTIVAKRKAELNALTPISYEEMEAVFSKWLIMSDKGVLKMLCGFYCAHKLPGKAVWEFLIGPSGGGKTAILDAMITLPDVVVLSMITPNTFLSGMPGKGDSSLLPQLNDKLVIMKDFTTVISMQKDAKSEVMSQFREIHDGGMKKVFGNGRTAEWNGKVTFLCATTQAIDSNQQQFTHLGERFVNYRMIMPDRKEVALRSLQNSNDQEQMTKELQNAMFAFMKNIDFSPEKLKSAVQIPEKYRQELANLANFCTMARSGIMRDFGMKKEVQFVPNPEMPTRIVGQLAKLASGIAMMYGGEINDEVMDIIYKVALDSIPQTNKMVINEMAKVDEQTTAEVATALGYPTDPIRLYLENLSLLQVCKRTKGGKGNADTWSMYPEFVEIIRKYEGVKELTEKEIEIRKDEAMTDVDREFDEF